MRWHGWGGVAAVSGDYVVRGESCFASTHGQMIRLSLFWSFLAGIDEEFAGLGPRCFETPSEGPLLCVRGRRRFPEP